MDWVLPQPPEAHLASLLGTVPTAAAPVVQPLLAVRNTSGAADKNQTLISIVRYAADPANGRPNVREVLVSSISNAAYLGHFLYRLGTAPI